MLKPEKLQYPETRKSDVVETLHGVKVTDPYRWLEDGESAETRQWIEAQNQLTSRWLDAIPARKAIRERLTKLIDYERYSLPSKRHSRYFYFHNSGLQNQAVLYVMEGLNGTPRLLLDPNTLSKDGTISLSGTSISEDGNYLAYAVASGGSDWLEWRVRDVNTGQDLSDKVEWSKFSGASWTHDHKGFFYSRYPAPEKGKELQAVNRNHKIYYHRLGTSQSEDLLIYERPDQPDWGFGAGVSEDGRYLIISVWQGTDRNNRLYYMDLRDPQNPVYSPQESPIRELITEGDARYGFIDNDSETFYFFTDYKAPRGRLIAVDINKPSRQHWREIIPQAKETLQGVSWVGDRFIATYLKDARSQVKRFHLDGKFEREIRLPGLGSVGGFGGKRGDPETFYQFTSFITPGDLYRYDVKTGKSELFRKVKITFDPQSYTARQVFYTGKDGTRIPMFLIHHKSLKRDGSNPTYLYGYGGFNISLTPSFSASNVAWLEQGGMIAIANLRGGGEYGKEWHDAGRLKNKQNVFDDFIAAAEWLIKNRYTSSPKLAISGASNGGLLVGACMTQRPDLFGACLPSVGVLDMLRFHKFTIGWAWISDYGDPDKPEDFEIIRKYSPLHNLKPGTAYPATLITTGDHDDRVHPAHSFKFAAALQAAQGGSAPTLIRIETRAGHGAGKPTQKIIDELSDVYAFLIKVLDVKR
ncbi:MAG: S9 family peptidase [Fimbriimonadia bacterium]|nr:S9 family peptidase [Fimbriimonadia bacterium]